VIDDTHSVLSSILALRLNKLETAVKIAMANILVRSLCKFVWLVFAASPLHIVNHNVLENNNGTVQEKKMTFVIKGVSARTA